MSPSATIAYYVTAHGYGHGVRSCDVIRALRESYPDLRVVVVSDLPEPFLRSRLPARGVALRRAAFDVGMVQVDSIRVDLPATLAAVREVYARRRDLVAREARWLEQERVAVVVADLPSLPLEAAAAAGLPRLAVGNFAWDWIYEEFQEQDPAWAEIVAQVRAGYAAADLLLRLPFAEEMTAFPRRTDIPLVARPGRADRARLARLTGADPGRHWVLLSFTSLDWDAAALARVERLKEHDFFTVRPLAWSRRNVHAVDRADMSFSDVIASVDAVVSKPGFGILSDCVVNDKPLVYAERTDFREYAVLVQGIERHLRHLHLPAERLYRGDLGEALRLIGRAPPPPRRLRAGGDLVAAQRIAEMASRL